MTSQQSWTGLDEKSVIDEMIRDPNSKHWTECHEYVRWRIQIQAKNIPTDKKEDLISEVMFRIFKFLDSFQNNSKLTTWIYSIISRCIADSYRKDSIIQLHQMPLEDVVNNDFANQAALTPEEIAIIRDELANALKALENYIKAHTKSDRNTKILYMVFFQGHSLEMAAREAGCSAAVAGYIVRSAQRYIRSL